MRILWDQRSRPAMSAVLILAFLAGLSICAVDSLAGANAPQAPAGGSSTVDARGHAAHACGHVPEDAEKHNDGDHCCTTFGERLGRAVQPTDTRLVNLRGPVLDLAVVDPSSFHAPFLTAADVHVPPPADLTSRSSPPPSLRAPPLSLHG